MTDPKFKDGNAVIIKNQIVGIILCHHRFMNEHWLYRIIVDAKEVVYRVSGKHFEQQDEFTFKEDLDTLKNDTEQIAVMEIFEQDLTLLE